MWGIKATCGLGGTNSSVSPRAPLPARHSLNLYQSCASPIFFKSKSNLGWCPYQDLQDFYYGSNTYGQWSNHFVSCQIWTIWQPICNTVSTVTCSLKNASQIWTCTRVLRCLKMRSHLDLLSKSPLSSELIITWVTQFTQELKFGCVGTAIWSGFDWILVFVSHESMEDTNILLQHEYQMVKV